MALVKIAPYVSWCGMSGGAGVTQTLTICWNVADISFHFQSPFLETSKTSALFDWLGENHVTPASPILISTELRNYSESLIEPARAAAWIIYAETDIDMRAVFSWENTRKCNDLENPSDFTFTSTLELS